MESPFEKLGRHVDPVHPGTTPHETRRLSKWTQSSDPLPKIAFGGYMEDWKSKISAALSRGSEKIFFSSC